MCISIIFPIFAMWIRNIINDYVECNEFEIKIKDGKVKIYYYDKLENFNDTTVTILKEKYEIEPKVEKNHIEITILTEQLPKVVKELAINDVEIKAVIPKEHTLEDIFFDATKGGKNE